MAQIIQKRRDTAANFTAANPILAQGEEAYELDTGKEKRGDGVTAWNALAYLDGTGTIKILGYEVDKNGNSDTANFEVNDRFHGWVDNTRYVRGIVVALPFDVNDDTKVKLVIDNII